MAKANKKPELSEEAIAKIRADIERWEPGKWAEEVNYGGACVCGLPVESRAKQASFTKHGKANYACPVHGAPAGAVPGTPDS